jgi:hypothetical protein
MTADSTCDRPAFSCTAAPLIIMGSRPTAGIPPHTSPSTASHLDPRTTIACMFNITVSFFEVAAREHRSWPGLSRF